MFAFAFQHQELPNAFCAPVSGWIFVKFCARRDSRGSNSLILICLAWLAAISSGLGQNDYQPGQAYFGRSNYIEYIAGDMPVILSAPHGGALKPAEIPDRKDGEFISDAYTEELARTVQQVFHNCFGHYPHVIICRLERHKLDCNRDVEEGAGDDPGARQAWHDYQRFIEAARSNVLARSGKGFYIDLHGQSNPIKRVELGYCLTGSQLTNADIVLNQPAYAGCSTLWALAQRTRLPFAELLRGTNSFGALLAAKGYPTVPSPAMPNPGPGNSYFDGGYNVRRHSSANGGVIDGLQMEVNYTGVRDTAINRTNFSVALAQVLDSFFRNHYRLDLRTGAAP
jgi:hypothetical protein